MMDELFFIKNKNGTWTVTDRAGNSATGVTKDIAKNLYDARYGITNNFCGPDISMKSIINQQTNPFI